ncbi:MAG: hypothetical protein GC158_08915 [Cyanobacteria bacterium RI_101]|nr:hypothetical protein [Cyanobacteria bacterium RI_101]
MLKILELAELYKIPKTQRPDFRDWLYWVPFVVNPLLGGCLTLAYALSEIELSPILSINIGASAPLILRTMAQIAPNTTASLDSPTD